MQENIENQTPSQPAAQPSAKPKRKWWRRVLCILSAVIFLPVFLLVGVLATASGTRLAIELADKLLDDLTIGEVSGGLQQGLLLRNVQFHSAGVTTNVAEARLQLDVFCLTEFKICINDLSVRQPEITIDTALLPPASDDSEREPMSMQRIHLPVAVEIGNIEVEDLSLSIDQNKMQLAQFKSAVSLDNENGLLLAPTQINDFSFVQTTTAEQYSAQLEQQKKIDAESKPIDWAEIERTLTPPLLAELQTIELPFDIKIADIEGKNWRYEHIIGDQPQKPIIVSNFRLQADTTDYLARLSTLTIESSIADIQGSGQIQLNDDFPLNLNIRSQFHQIGEGEEILLPASSSELTLSGSLKKQTAFSLQTKGVLDSELSGMVELNRDKIPLQIRLQSSSFKFPFVTKDAEQLRTRNVDLYVTGNLLDYKVKLTGQLEGMYSPSVDITLSGHGGLSQAVIENAKLKALNGTANVQGSLDWKNGVRWQSKAELNKLHAGDYPYSKNWPAVLSGNFQCAGYAGGDGWDIDVNGINLSGTLSNRSLALKGALQTNTAKWLDAKLLTLTYGENTLDAEGYIGRQSDIKLNINGPNLRGLLPDLSASLNGKLDLSGNVSAPKMKFNFTGNNIQFNELRLNKLFAKGDVNMHTQAEGRIDLELAGFNYGEVKIPRADVWLTGSEQNHQFHLRANGEPVAATLNFYGNFDRTSQKWAGILSQIELKSPLGVFRNDKNINLNYDNKQLQTTISAHCWQNPDIHLCFPQAFKAGKNGEVPFDIRQINLELVNKLTQQENLLRGQLRSQGKVAWSGNKPISMNLLVSGDNLSLAKKIDYRTFRLNITKLALDSRLENNNLTVKSDVLLQNQGNINTNLMLSDIAKGRKLSGSLAIRQLNLSLLKQLFSNDENLTGDVAANLTFGGSLSAPLLNGSFNINQIRAKMKSLPFTISDGDIALNFYGNRSTLLGTIKTAESSLTLDGDASWRNLEQWNSRVRVKTEQFRVDLQSMAKLKINADVEAQADPELLKLSGNVGIPWARIAVETLPESAVSVSSDEVILDGKTTQKSTALPTQIAAKTKSGMAIQSDLKIKIGDDVNVNAYGLNSNLEGLLSVKQEKGNLGLFGQINLKNGRYASFGQDLLIRKGQISFSGLPSQPVLNIEAIRNPEAMEDSKVTAGVKVIGAADSPKVEVFSEPSMPQDQALSYILTGRSLENSGEAGSSGSVGAALLGLGLGKSGKVVGSIGKTFGIQDLNLGTAGVGDSSKVVVSGNISPRLQVKYGVGLFDGLAEVTLRYKLIPQLYLQSVSGVAQAFDLLYQFEF